MLLLGSERVVTQDYNTHKDAEDYVGEHLSDIRINGKAKVIKVVNKYMAHEDAINYNEYMKNKNTWKDGTYYNCVSITGKTVRYHQSELGGNQVELECYDNNEKRIIRILHMAEVLVNVGEVIDSTSVIGKQGNTGLVLSKKEVSNNTYGSHVHIEVLDRNYQYLNPRDYANFAKTLNYQEQTNEIDNSKKQIKIMVDKINIRMEASKDSTDIGDVYYGEIYDVLGVIEDDNYTWYNIKTSLGLGGYVANEKNKNWLFVTKEEENIEGNVKEVDEAKEVKLIFTCVKDGMYAIKLKTGERLYLE